MGSLNFICLSGNDIPRIRGFGKLYLKLGWQYVQKELALKEDELAELKELDEALLLACPPGVVMDCWSVCAIKRRSL